MLLVLPETTWADPGESPVHPEPLPSWHMGREAGITVRETEADFASCISVKKSLSPEAKDQSFPLFIICLYNILKHLIKPGVSSA